MLKKVVVGLVIAFFILVVIVIFTTDFEKDYYNSNNFKPREVFFHKAKIKKAGRSVEIIICDENGRKVLNLINTIGTANIFSIESDKIITIHRLKEKAFVLLKFKTQKTLSDFRRDFLENKNLFEKIGNKYLF